MPDLDYTPVGRTDSPDPELDHKLAGHTVEPAGRTVGPDCMPVGRTDLLGSELDYRPVGRTAAPVGCTVVLAVWPWHGHLELAVGRLVIVPGQPAALAGFYPSHTDSPRQAPFYRC